MPTLSQSAAAQWVTHLLLAGGLDAAMAPTVGRLMALTDALGRRTHGLALLPLYLRDLQQGKMARSGTPTVLKDTGATLVWDGHYLPGLWLVSQAISLARERIGTHGVVSIAIRRNHHIGSLATLCKEATDHGLIALITNSDPSGKRAAPYGGKEAVFTPNPFAFGYPGTPNAVLVDTCASITTTSMTRQKVAEGSQFEHAWLLDGDGKPTKDPRVLENSTPRGSLQLIGGLEYGHKGFGLALMVEALSQGLSGHGRAEAPTQWGGNTFVQVIDPEFFAGADAFELQTGTLAAQCRASAPIDPSQPVRLPGDQAAANLAQAQTRGIDYDDTTWKALSAYSEQLGVAVPG
jgi:LDH2 family malate/lactate/ureidoglycolate dehydrogenase